MVEAVPSRTAVSVALRRAVHQLRDVPIVFHDPVAVPMLSSQYADSLNAYLDSSGEPFAIAMRAHLIARSRYAEDNLRGAVESGVTQYVLLGAGLDTFGYRNPYPQLRVFEVDHPATQQWKRALLTRSGIAIPENLTYAPVNFETESLAAQLTASGFDRQAPAYFAWLGVVPYLTLSAFRATIALIAAQPVGSGVTFDYGQPREVLPRQEQFARDALASRVQSAGEPFQIFFTPEQIAAELSGLSKREDLGATEINARYFAQRSDHLAIRGSSGRLLCAWR
jgi:methyltransferase (TIGR00027 family)